MRESILLLHTLGIVLTQCERRRRTINIFWLFNKITKMGVFNVQRCKSAELLSEINELYANVTLAVVAEGDVEGETCIHNTCAKKHGGKRR